MARFLFPTWEGGGHVQPLLLVARGLKARGHEALVLSDICNATDAAALDLDFLPWTTAPNQTGKSREDDRLKDHEAQSPLDVINRLLDRVMTGPAAAYARDVTTCLKDFPADVIVSQELLLGVMIAAEAAKIPLALFTANIWSLPTLPGATPFGAGMARATNDEERAMHAMVSQMSRGFFQSGLDDLNTARAQLDLEPLSDVFDQLGVARRILLGASQAFDFAPSPLPPPFRYVGPYLSDPAWARPVATPKGQGPLVLVSFSSLYQAQEAILTRVIEALGDLPVRALVTTGPTVSPEDLPHASNVTVVRSAQHGELLKDAALFITHAGHGSTLRPLMAGVPLLCLPLGRDQYDNAVRATARGAGLSLPADASVMAIREAVTRILGNSEFRASAQALGEAISHDEAVRSAEQELEVLLLEHPVRAK